MKDDPVNPLDPVPLDDDDNPVDDFLSKASEGARPGPSSDREPDDIPSKASEGARPGPSSDREPNPFPEKDLRARRGSS
jgi:hypothetical protein